MHDQSPLPHGGGALPESFEEIIQRLGDRWLGGPDRYTGDQVAAMGGVDRQVTKRLWRAMGLADTPDHEAVLGPADLDAVRRVADLIGSAGLSVSDVVYLARVLGLATAQMADSVIGFQAGHLGVDADEGSDPEPRPPIVVEELDDLVAYLLHRHLLDALVRRLPSLGSSDVSVTTAVGFADLVGYTALSQELDEWEIAALVEDFEAVASDLVVAGGGRVVKMIGDAVMFSAPAELSAEIALGLTAAFTGRNVPPVRIGMASGRAVSRGGDLFGPVVNLASRATGSARPGAILVTPELAAGLGVDPRYRLQRIRPRRLKGIGVVTLSKLLRAPAEPPARPPTVGRPPVAPGRRPRS